MIVGNSRAGNVDQWWHNLTPLAGATRGSFKLSRNDSDAKAWMGHFITYQSGDFQQDLFGSYDSGIMLLNLMAVRLFTTLPVLNGDCYLWWLLFASLHRIRSDIEWESLVLYDLWQGHVPDGINCRHDPDSDASTQRPASDRRHDYRKRSDGAGGTLVTAMRSNVAGVVTYTTVNHSQTVGSRAMTASTTTPGIFMSTTEVSPDLSRPDEQPAFRAYRRFRFDGRCPWHRSGRLAPFSDRSSAGPSGGGSG